LGTSHSGSADLRQIQCENVHLNQRVPLASHLNCDFVALSQQSLGAFPLGTSHSESADLRQIQCENVHLNQRVPLASHLNCDFVAVGEWEIVAAVSNGSAGICRSWRSLNICFPAA
jgi:hypothetical protein